MSKENNNLRLFGSPVNLSYRNKKKDDRKNIRNRPRSALQTSCISPDIPERYKRPFSADAKAPSTRNLLNTFHEELLQSYNNTPTLTTIKIVAPTTELLGDRKSPENLSHRRDLCSNASDYGSEDTFISLGTKIKAKAQVHSPKPKNTNTKNYLKYRHIAKKGRKSMENTVNDDVQTNEYGMEVKITEKQRSPTRSPSPSRNKNIFNERSLSPSLKSRPYESYFIPLEGEKKETEDALLGRVSFGIHAEVEQAIDKYSRRLTLTKQQLSLVEEESTQDLDSVPSHNSLSPEVSLEHPKKEDNMKHRTYETKDDYPQSSHNFMCDPRTYTSFYDDIRTENAFKTKLSSTAIHTDTSSKDSGYPDSGANDDRYKQNYSLPGTSIKRSSSHNNIEQPQSMDSASTSSNRQNYHKTYPLDRKEQWLEPLNQSRMLYKDFFLKKEGHVALPPNNSPVRNKAKLTTEAPDKNEPELEYPEYLSNSTTKAYTSKVIEDYKKELEAINCLHELTIKDIQTDAVSPTPLNIDKMFEDAANFDKQDVEKSPPTQETAKNKTSNEIKQRRDISKISTKELIENYLKVKEGDATKELVIKTLEKYDKKINNVNPKFENIPSRYKRDWNNKMKPNITKSSSNSQINVRNPTQKNMFTIKAPLSARIEGVHNDKDIDSWISITDPAPIEKEDQPVEPTPITPVETEPNIVEHKVETRQLVTPRASAEKDSVKPKELNPNSSVLDIYSMLKEIESYGDNPVTSVAANVPEEETKNEEDNKTPNDNFLEIFQFLEKVEQSANDALSVVTSTTPQTIPKLEVLLKLPQTELAQRLVTATLQLEERSCCIALLQESLTNHKEQMMNKISNLERQSLRNVSKVKLECEDTIKRHQSFIDQLINDKKTLNHRIEQLVDERRSLEERWKRSAQALEERYKLELRNQHDKMAAAQQVARQRWVRQKAEKIKELTVKGLEGELREMAERQQKEISDLKMSHAEQVGRSQARHAQEMDELRRRLQDEKELALVKERQMAASRLEKQILELELTYQEQRTRLVAEMRAENERVACGLGERERAMRDDMETWRKEQEMLIAEKRTQLENEIALERQKTEELLKLKQDELESRFAQHRQNYEAEQQMLLKKKVTEIAAQHKLERDREIEKAIENMDAEAQAGRRDLQDALRRNKEQYEAELKSLAETEQATLRRFQEAQARVRQTEDRCAELEVNANQLETRNRVLTEKNIQLEARADEIRESCEEAWRGKMDALRKEMEDARRTHEEQMHQLYAKVKVAVARKDSAIQGLTREAARYQEKILTLEQKLQQQRKDFLKQK